MPNSNIHTISIVNELIKKTNEDKIDWKQGAIDSSFIYSIDSASIEICETSKNYIFRINNELGKTIVTMTEERPFTILAPQAGPLGTLLRLARKKVNRFDETIEEIYTHISGL